MSIDHDAEIETDELRTAMAKLEQVLHAGVEVPSLFEASERINEAGAAIGELSYEEALVEAKRQIERAEDLIDDYIAYADRQYQDGRVRMRAETFVYLRRCLVESQTACAEWISYANRELAEIA